MKFKAFSLIKLYWVPGGVVPEAGGFAVQLSCLTYEPGSKLLVSPLKPL